MNSWNTLYISLLCDQIEISNEEYALISNLTWKSFNHLWWWLACWIILRALQLPERAKSESSELFHRYFVVFDSIMIGWHQFMFYMSAEKRKIFKPKQRIVVTLNLWNYFECCFLKIVLFFETSYVYDHRPSDLLGLSRSADRRVDTLRV